MKYALEQVLPPNDGEEPIIIPLTEDEVFIGRKSIIELHKFHQMSKRHAVFYNTEEGFLFVKDLESLNGIYVNNVKIGASLKLLKLGDIIGFGIKGDQVQAGFVCVVTSDISLQIKQEVPDSDGESALENTEVSPLRNKKNENSPRLFEDTLQVKGEVLDADEVSVVENSAASSVEHTEKDKNHPRLLEDTHHVKQEDSDTDEISLVEIFAASKVTHRSEQNRNWLLEDTFQVKQEVLDTIDEVSAGENTEASPVRNAIQKNENHPRLHDQHIAFEAYPTQNSKISPLKNSQITFTASENRDLALVTPQGAAREDKVSRYSNSPLSETSFSTYKSEYSPTSSNVFDSREVTAKVKGISTPFVNSSDSEVLKNFNKPDSFSSNERNSDTSLHSIQMILNKHSSSASNVSTKTKHSSTTFDTPFENSSVYQIKKILNLLNVPSRDGTESRTFPAHTIIKNENCAKRRVSKCANSPPLIDISHSPTHSNISASKDITAKLKHSPIRSENSQDPPFQNIFNLLNFASSGKTYSNVDSIQKNQNIGEKISLCMNNSPLNIVSEPMKSEYSVNLKSDISNIKYLDDDLSSESNDNIDGYAKNDFKYEKKSLGEVNCLQECSIPLIRCDSKYFEWPPDVKNPFISTKLLAASNICKNEKQASCLSNNSRFDDNAADFSLKTSIGQITSQKRKYPNDEALILADKTNYPKNIKFEKHSDKEMNYSQASEMIYISDDEQYFDFNSSQNYVMIKSEPEDIGEYGFNENLEYKNFRWLASENIADNYIYPKEESENTETVNSAKAFIDETQLKEPMQDNCEGNVHSNSVCDFPLTLSQILDSDQENSMDCDAENNIGKKSKIIQSPQKQLPNRKILSDMSGSVKITITKNPKKDHSCDEIADHLSKQSCVLTSDTQNRKTPAVAALRRRFASRMTFLADAIKINPRKYNKIIENDLNLSVKQSNTPGSTLNKTLPQNITLSPTSCSNATYNCKNPEKIQNTSSTQNSSLPCSAGKNSNPKDDVNLKVKQTFKMARTLSSTREYTFNASCKLKYFQMKSRLIQELLQLNTKWLEEQTNNIYPPLPVSDGAANLPISFHSLNYYISAFYPMVRLEIWEKMYEESLKLYASNKQYKKFYFSVLSLSTKKDQMVLKCESLFNQVVSFVPLEGTIAIFELRDTFKSICPVFGFVSELVVETLDFNPMEHLKWNRLPNEWKTNAKFCTFYVQIEKTDMPIDLNSLMKGNGLCTIKNQLNMVCALSCLKSSPLLDTILRPSWGKFKVNYPVASPSTEFNCRQMTFINSVADEIVKSRERTKIILLRGPPGTGKTHAILGVIQEYLTLTRYDPTCKILVTAPSNVAIDEIGCRLITMTTKLKYKDVKLVRVGMEEELHARMKPYSLDFLVQERTKKDKEKELQMLQNEISRLKKVNGDESNIVKHREEKFKLLYEGESSMEEGYHTKMAQNVLRDSHIILSTLNSCVSIFSSCGISCMSESTFQFSFCIVEESTQCTELEILQPLMLGIRKLILVGDPIKLPATVLSKVACQYGFERSLFERFQDYFAVHFPNIPTYTLIEQFRMHPAICDFPSRHFYNQVLVTSPEVNNESYPFMPYMVLDIYVNPEKYVSPSDINWMESELIYNICTVLVKVKSSLSVGIIVPCQDQRIVYKRAFCKNPLYRDIEINTVDGFQSREKDIIIVSTASAKCLSHGIDFLTCERKLNVTLTRAKKSLIVCGQAYTLLNFNGWRELLFDAKERGVCFSLMNPRDVFSLLRR